MLDTAGRRCEIDRIYAIAFSDDPSIGTLTPTYCSHQSTRLVTVRSRRADSRSTTPGFGTFGVCGTHYAIIEALDRVIRGNGGETRMTGYANLDPLGEAPNG